MIILGIDPGTTIMGYGLIEQAGKEPKLVTMGVIELYKIDHHYDRLNRIFHRIDQIIREYLPEEVALEAPFYGKNVQSMLKLGRAQGVAMSAALSHSLPIFEYAPRKIKQSITGNGNASKEQVAGMLESMFSITDMPKNLDATDGLAAAVCHFYNCKTHPSGSDYKSWKDYMRKNPGRIKD
ncbi:MAG: crossover junction endodeoxyribonuclease RuvC [Bacteroidales bacterium]|nr:crossover junction endodeoxyribonuclease RuvC [Bacteroidales bacterium]